MQEENEIVTIQRIALICFSFVTDSKAQKSKEMGFLLDKTSLPGTSIFIFWKKRCTDEPCCVSMCQSLPHLTTVF